MADGMALMQVLLSLTDESRRTPTSSPAPAAVTGRGPLGGGGRTWRARPATALLDAPRLLTTAHAGDAATTAQAGHRRHDQAAARAQPEVGRRRRGDAVEAGDLGPADPAGDVVALGHRTGTTVNDVLMAALAGALSTYLAARRQRRGRRTSRRWCPVNLRPSTNRCPASWATASRWCCSPCRAALTTPFARLAETKRRMDAIKHSPEAALTLGMIQGIGRTGPGARAPGGGLLRQQGDRGDHQRAGPRTPRYVAGTRISGMLGWAPESGNQALGTAIFTYDGSVFVGFKVDTGVIIAPGGTVGAFVAEIETLCQLAATRMRAVRPTSRMPGRDACWSVLSQAHVEDEPCRDPSASTSSKHSLTSSSRRVSATTRV